MGESSFIEQIAPTLFAVVVTGLIGFIATTRGRLAQRNDSHDEWLRANRLTAYLEFNRVTDEMSAGMRSAHWALRRYDLDQVIAAITQSGEAITRLTDVMARVAILGPEEPAEAASAAVGQWRLVHRELGDFVNVIRDAVEERGEAVDAAFCADVVPTRGDWAAWVKASRYHREFWRAAARQVQREHYPAILADD